MVITEEIPFSDELMKIYLWDDVTMAGYNRIWSVDFDVTVTYYDTLRDLHTNRDKTHQYAIFNCGKGYVMAVDPIGMGESIYAEIRAELTGFTPGFGSAFYIESFVESVSRIDRYAQQNYDMKRWGDTRCAWMVHQFLEVAWTDHFFRGGRGWV